MTANDVSGFANYGNGVGSWGQVLVHFFVTNKLQMIIIMGILIMFAIWVAYYIWMEFLAENAQRKRLKIGKFKVDIRGYVRWFLGRALRRPGYGPRPGGK